MKCQILLSRKNKKKYFKMLSAENFTSMRSVIVNTVGLARLVMAHSI